MNDTSQVSTLRQLRERKAELKAEMSLSQTELIKSLGTSQSQAGDYLLKRIVLPAGAVVLTVLVLKKLLFGKKSHSRGEVNDSPNLAVARTVYPEAYQAAPTAPQQRRSLPPTETHAEESYLEGFNVKPILSFASSMAIPAIRAIYHELNKRGEN